MMESEEKYKKIILQLKDINTMLVKVDQDILKIQDNLKSNFLVNEKPCNDDKIIGVKTMLSEVYDTLNDDIIPDMELKVNSLS